MAKYSNNYLRFMDNTDGYEIKSIRKIRQEVI
jgi:hypothetical protein